MKFYSGLGHFYVIKLQNPTYIHLIVPPTFTEPFRKVGHTFSSLSVEVLLALFKQFFVKRLAFFSKIFIRPHLSSFYSILVYKEPVIKQQPQVLAQGLLNRLVTITTTRKPTTCYHLSKRGTSSSSRCNF